MESDRVQARGGDHARGEERRGRRRRPRAAGSTGCATAECPAIGGIDTRALVRHIRDRGAMRGGIFPAELAEAEARDRVAAEPSMDGADFARTVTPDEPVEFDGDGPHVVGIDTGIKLSILRQFRERNCRLTLASVLSLRRRGPGKGPGSGLPRQRPGRPRRPRLRGRERPRDRRQEAGGGHLPRPPAALPGGGPRDLQAAASATAAPTTRSRISRPAGSTSPRRTTASRCSARAATGRSTGDEPVRWQTDFGEAELSHLNLYDRTVEGLVLKDVPGCTVQYHPEAGPGPHDARYLFDRFLELAQ